MEPMDRFTMTNFRDIILGLSKIGQMLHAVVLCLSGCIKYKDLYLLVDILVTN